MRPVRVAHNYYRVGKLLVALTPPFGANPTQWVVLPKGDYPDIIGRFSKFDKAVKFAAKNQPR